LLIQSQFQRILQTFGGCIFQWQTNCKTASDTEGKSIEQIKELIKDDPTSVVEYLIEISLPAEDYEICEAAKQVLKKNTSL
jgi:hypothetical protein